MSENTLPDFDPNFGLTDLPDFDPRFGIEESAATKVGKAIQRVGDVAISAGKGVIGVPQAVVGLADLATGGQAGKSAEDAGIRFKETQDILSGLQSPEQQAANAEVAGADGFVDTTRAAIRNPSVIAGSVAESLPAMGISGVIARGGFAGAGAISKALAEKAVPIMAGIGEGAVTAGQIAEQVRAENPDGLLTGKQAAASAAAGVVTGGIGAAAAKLVNTKFGRMLGLHDVDAMIAQGGPDAVTANAAKQGFFKSLLSSGFSEGVLEELPQSAQEQMWQNYAQGKPVMEGVGNAAATGMLAGAAMGGAGGGWNAAMASHQPEPTEPTEPVDQPEYKPMSGQDQPIDLSVPGQSVTPEAAPVSPEAATAQATEPSTDTEAQISRLSELELLADQRGLSPQEQGEYQAIAQTINQETNDQPNQAGIEAQAAQQDAAPAQPVQPAESPVSAEPSQNQPVITPEAINEQSQNTTTQAPAAQEALSAFNTTPKALSPEFAPAGTELPIKLGGRSKTIRIPQDTEIPKDRHAWIDAEVDNGDGKGYQIAGMPAGLLIDAINGKQSEVNDGANIALEKAAEAKSKPVRDSYLREAEALHANSQKQEPKPKKSALTLPPSGNEELQTAIRKLGGIRREGMADRSGFTDFKGRKYTGLFNNGKNAKTFDEMAELLRGYGYTVDGENDLIEKLYGSLNGQPHYSPAGAESYAARLHEEQAKAEQSQAESENAIEAAEERAAIQAEQEISDDEFDAIFETVLSNDRRNAATITNLDDIFGPEDAESKEGAGAVDTEAAVQGSAESGAKARNDSTTDRKSQQQQRPESKGGDEESHQGNEQAGSARNGISEAAQKAADKFKANPQKIVNDLTARGKIKDLHDAAGVMTSAGFKDLPMADKVAAYVKMTTGEVIPGAKKQTKPVETDLFVNSEEERKQLEAKQGAADVAAAKDKKRQGSGEEPAPLFSDNPAMAGQVDIADIDAAAHEAATSPNNDLPEPTQAQKEAGNYKKGHITWNGLDIAIENPQGSTRSGVDSNGNKWSVDMVHHYGYIKRTEGADGDQVDIFMGPRPESQNVFVVNQIDPRTKQFDEHKVMLGFNSREEARAGYLTNYAKGWKGIGSITPMSLDEFKKELSTGELDKPIKQPSNTQTTKTKASSKKSESQLNNGQPNIDDSGFVLSDGERDFGEINSSIASVIKRQAGPIRLLVGEHKATNRGYGLVHIQEGHPEIDDPVGFVKDVAQNFTEIWKTNQGRLLLVKRGSDKSGLVSIVQLTPHEDGDYYGVVTSYKSRSPNGEMLLWSAAHSQTADSGVQPALQSKRHKASGVGKSAERKEDNSKIAQPQESSTGDYGKANKVFTEDAAVKARELLKSKLGTVRSGLDPEMIQAGITLAGYHIEAGAREFSQYTKAMLADLGDGIKPYLRSFYESVRYYPGFDSAGMSTAEEIDNVSSTDSGLESDSANANDEDRANEKPVRPERTSDGQTPRKRGGKTQGERLRPGSDSGNTIDVAAAGREHGNQPVHSTEQPVVASELAPGVDDSERGDAPGNLGIQSKPLPSGEVDSLSQPRDKKTAATGSVVLSDLDNIRATLPVLNPGQVQDVKFAEDRFSGHSGVLFTNGTGTGKTFSGLGVIKRFAMRGNDNVIIAVPSVNIADQWRKAAGKFFDLPISLLENTRDAGKGVVITTYANFGMNRSLVGRDWDLIVADESHKLMQNEAGDETDALKTLRALSFHHRGFYPWMEGAYPDVMDELRAARSDAEVFGKDDTMDQLYRAAQARLDKALDAYQAALKEGRERYAELQKTKSPKVMFLSATPFAYVKTVDYAEGYLFHYDKEADGGAYNSGDGRERFFMSNFGYRMRYNKLTAPEANVDTGIMERQFNSTLKKAGALSFRMLDVPYDYDRKFQLVDNALGRRIDEAMEWIRENEYRELAEELNDKFDHLQRRYLLEAIKAKEAIPIIKDHLAHGRKVVVFHDYKKGGATNPFLLRAPGSGPLADQIREFSGKFKDIIQSFDYLPSPIAGMRHEFGDGVMVYNGDVSAKERIKLVEQFNDDNSGKNLILVQSASAKEGVSFHDTTGKHQRILINLGLPTQPTTAIQQEGRIYRVGQQSDALFRYINTGTNWERWAFATTIANRASTAENLGAGEGARALKDAFINGFENSDDYPAGHEGEGKGGKEADKAATGTLTEFERAKSFYFGQQKKTSRNKSAEGTDYFATPEPVGMKMAEWADIRTGDHVLEPSAGHGAIARWFRDDAIRTAIEPSGELSSRLAMVFDGDIKRQTFEDLHIVNKYNAIVMNPPFGVGGKVAIEHLDKAFKHLPDNGRIVALIPQGSSADKRFEKWFYDNDATKHAHLIASVSLPNVTFERAGTGVKTRIVVIDKITDPELAQGIAQKNIELDNAENIGELFDRIENIAMPDRKAPVIVEPESTPAAWQVVKKANEAANQAAKEAETKASEAGVIAADASQATFELVGDKILTNAPAEQVTTKKGKVLDGVFVPDEKMARTVDQFTYRPNGKEAGWFVRLRHIQRPEAADTRLSVGKATDSAPSLVKLFETMGKKSSKSAPIEVDQHPQAELIKAVQDHWSDVILAVGYEKADKSDNPNGKVLIKC